MIPGIGAVEPEPQSGRVHVLLVDDREENLLTLEATLSRLDLELVFARSGAEALRRVLHHDFALILLDVNMPGMDGLETAALVRQRPRSRHVPIIFLTADPDQTGLRQAYSLGAVDYLLTPYDPAVLRTKVGVFVELYRNSAEITRQAELLHAAESAQRREAERALRSTDERLRRMIESAKDYAIFALDPGGAVASWNFGAERLFGFAEAEIVGQPHARLYAANERDSGAEAAQRERAVASGRSERDGWHVRRDGTAFVGNEVMTTIAADDGALIGFTVVVRDVTEARRAEEELRDADRRKDEFLAVLAHELRNPLAAISNAVRVTRTPGLARLHDGAIGAIERQAAHLSRLTDDLLDIARLRRGKVDLRLAPVDLCAVVSAATDSVLPFVRERGHRIALELPPSALWVTGDSVRLEQVVANLVTNAAKYSPEPGEIVITASRLDDVVEVRVRDHGVGIAPDALQSVFEMFVQATPTISREFRGLGIGLTLARQLVELHAGRIWVTSDGVGKGSEFTVQLPALATMPAVAASSAPESQRASSPSLRPLKILIVDDNEDSAMFLEALLQNAGHEVSVVHDGESALEAVRRDPPRIVLLDLGLPGIDGFEVAARVRAEHAGISLIAISGYGQERDRERTRAAGFDDHFLKPIDFDELLRCLARVEAVRAR